ncbi:hypothetical protein pb186bvf_001637 [Paramecium bursaria]
MSKQIALTHIIIASTIMKKLNNLSKIPKLKYNNDVQIINHQNFVLVRIMVENTHITRTLLINPEDRLSSYLTMIYALQLLIVKMIKIGERLCDVYKKAKMLCPSLDQQIGYCNQGFVNIYNMYELEQSDIIVLDLKLWGMELADLIEVNDYGGRQEIIQQLKIEYT